MNSFNARVIAKCTVNVERPVEDLFRFWRNFENLTEVFTQIREIQVISPNRTRWFAVAPVGTAIEWETEIVAETPNELIAWRSVPGSQLLQEGTVRFKEMENGRNTRVTVTMRYGATGMALTDHLRKVFGSDPGLELERDLKRFKTRLGPPVGPAPDSRLPFRLLSGLVLTQK